MYHLQVLKGNSYKNYVSGNTNTFHPALFAHDIRVYPLKVNGVTTGKEETFAPCLRMEFYGCHGKIALLCQVSSYYNNDTTDRVM